MTKSEYNNYDGKLHCLSCNRIVPKCHMYYKKVYKNGDVQRCNVCEWIKRNNNKLESIDFPKETIVELLHWCLYESNDCMNDIAQKLHLTIDDVIKIYNDLGVRNKTIYIYTNCDYCGKVRRYKPSAYKKAKNHYCSDECYYNDKTNTVSKGTDNSQYNRIKTKCTNCGIEISVIPANYYRTNRYGDNHNFCSNNCYWEYRSKYYVGEKSTMYNLELTEEQRNNARINLIKRMSSDDRLNTGIQVRVNDILDDLSIKYEREYFMDYYSVDNYLIDYNGIIEVMGDYWHTSPIRYNKDGYCISQLQEKQLHRDKIKKSYIKNKYNVNILYLWEYDINQRKDVCIELIKKYINNNCILDNYNSFNWEVVNNTIQLRNDIITPYQDLSLSQYKDIIKTK